MADFLYTVINDLELGTPYLVAPDVGTAAALFLAARHPGSVRSLIVGGGAVSYPLEVAGSLADIIAAPDLKPFRDQDIRATIGALVEPVASRRNEPAVWEDYVASSENGRFAEACRYVRSYPETLQELRQVLPSIEIPVNVISAVHDDIVPPANGTYLDPPPLPF